MHRYTHKRLCLKCKVEQVEKSTLSLAELRSQVKPLLSKLERPMGQCWVRESEPQCELLSESGMISLKIKRKKNSKHLVMVPPLRDWPSFHGKQKKNSLVTFMKENILEISKHFDHKNGLPSGKLSYLEPEVLVSLEPKWPAAGHIFNCS